MWRRTVTFTVLTPYNAAPHNRYQPHPAEPAQHTTCSNIRLVLQKMGIMMPETCWESVDNKHLTVASCWFFLSLHNRLCVLVPFVEKHMLMFFPKTRKPFKTGGSELLLSPHGMCLCEFYRSQDKHWISDFYNSGRSVYCAVRTESYYAIHYSFRLDFEQLPWTTMVKIYYSVSPLTEYRKLWLISDTKRGC